MDFITKFSKQNHTKKKFKKLNCHPKNLTSKKVHDKSCLDFKTLKLLKEIWNKRHPDVPIKGNKKKVIWNSLQQKMKNSCSNELCWIDESLNKNENKDKIKRKLFAPITPKSWKNNKNEWLSSIDIINVMKQYEEKYHNFDFLGPSPIDFETMQYNNMCVWPEICNIQINNYIKKNKNKLGFIFNTDPHYKSGAHWIATMIDLDKCVVFFFDSNGNPPPKELKIFFKKIIKQCNKCNKKMKYDSNVNFRHQESNTECGMYCLYFIISLLDKKHNFNYFKKNKISDEKVEEFRNIFFNNI